MPIDVYHEDAFVRTFILFIQAAHATLKYADSRFYRKARLSASKFTVLTLLAANGGSMTPSEIAKQTLRERHNITTLVDRLGRDGLVASERNGRDRRSVSVKLTAKGRKVVSETKSVAKEIVSQVMSSISESDVVVLEGLLRVLRQNSRHGLEHAAKGAQPQPD